ncbi:MAG TPA: MotA/TolQ/ExbB proton channel family protein [Clostridiales bacterium]|nr:MotA/TolQ/ExbB proton channel family protein [Clostridiales bacterium]
MYSETLNQALRTLAEALRSPVILLLLILCAVAVLMLGSLLAELFSERLRLKAKMPLLADAIKDPQRSLAETIADSGLLKRQRAALNELIAHPQLTPVMREALARRLLFQEQTRYDRLISVTDLTARLGPMLGLLGTLIPLGPGLIALGQGDTYTLSQSLLVAFDTTIAGLAAAALAYVISMVRRKWYENYMTLLEALMECILEREAVQNEE